MFNLFSRSQFKVKRITGFKPPAAQIVSGTEAIAIAKEFIQKEGGWVLDKTQRQTLGRVGSLDITQHAIMLEFTSSAVPIGKGDTLHITEVNKPNLILKTLNSWFPNVFTKPVVEQVAEPDLLYKFAEQLVQDFGDEIFEVYDSRPKPRSVGVVSAA